MFKVHVYAGNGQIRCAQREKWRRKGTKVQWKHKVGREPVRAYGGKRRRKKRAKPQKSSQEKAAELKFFENKA